MSYDESAIAEKRLLELATRGTALQRRRSLHKSPLVMINSPKETILSGKSAAPYRSFIVDKSEIVPPMTIHSRFLLPTSDLYLKSDLHYKANYLRSKLLLPIETRGLEGWAKNQIKYISELSKREYDILQSYTFTGDKLVNNYVRGTLGEDISTFRISTIGVGEFLFDAMLSLSNIPLAYSFLDQYNAFIKIFEKKGIALPPRASLVDSESGNIEMDTVRKIFDTHRDFFNKSRNILTLIEQYKNDLIEIIAKSPRLKRDIIVYRGIKNEQHVKNSSIHTVDFLSTSLDPALVVNYTTPYDDPSAKSLVTCCVYEITLKAGTPCIYLQTVSSFSMEYEVLIAPGQTMTISNKMYVKISPEKEDFVIANLEDPSKYHKVVVVPVTIANTKSTKSHIFTSNSRTIRDNYYSTKKKFKTYKRKKTHANVIEENDKENNNEDNS